MKWKSRGNGISGGNGSRGSEEMEVEEGRK